MKELILCAFVFYNIIVSSTRLIQRSTELPKAVHSSEEDVKDSSSTEKLDGPAIIHFYKGNVRMSRQDKVNNSAMENGKRRVKIPLVKKPIPKFKEADSDEDYETKLIKPSVRAKLADSAEFEDQDFSVDDYDFDVNHDEFTGRGKPLEPRKYFKQTSEGKTPKSVQITKRNLNVVGRENAIKQKLVQKKISKAIHKLRKDDNNEELTTPMNISEGTSKRPSVDDDLSDESESSSEYTSFIRNARSPWNIGTYVNKLGEKSSEIMSKALSFLTIYPQIPQHKKMTGIDTNH